MLLNIFKVNVFLLENDNHLGRKLKFLRLQNSMFYMLIIQVKDNLPNVNFSLIAVPLGEFLTRT